MHTHEGACLNAHTWSWVGPIGQVTIGSAAPQLCCEVEIKQEKLVSNLLHSFMIFSRPFFFGCCGKRSVSGLNYIMSKKQPRQT